MTMKPEACIALPERDNISPDKMDGVVARDTIPKPGDPHRYQQFHDTQDREMN